VTGEAEMKVFLQVCYTGQQRTGVVARDVEFVKGFPVGLADGGVIYIQYVYY
jgi:hypothetical protein